MKTLLGCLTFLTLFSMSSVSASPVSQNLVLDLKTISNEKIEKSYRISRSSRASRGRAARFRGR